MAQLYFIALLADEEVSRQAMLQKQYMLKEYGCRVALKSPPHITIVPPFSMKTEEKPLLGACLEKIQIPFDSIYVQTRNYGHFGNRVIFIEIENSIEINNLVNQVYDHLNFCGFSFIKDERPFHPHITIANRDIPKRNFREIYQHFDALQLEQLMTINSLALLKNEPGKWYVIHTFPLSS